MNNNLERITTKKLFGDLLSILNLERGALYTLVETAKNPWRLISSYLYEDRSRIMNSFRLLILIVTIATFITLKSDVFKITFEATIDAQEVETKTIETDIFKQKIGELMQRNLSLLSFLLVPFVGIFTYWFFRKQRLNLAEHVTAQAYLISLNTAISTLLIPLAYVNFSLYGIIPLLILMVYHVWFCLSFSENKSKAKTILASLGSLFLGFSVFYFLMGLSAAIYVGLGYVKQ